MKRIHLLLALALALMTLVSCSGQTGTTAGSTTATTNNETEATTKATTVQTTTVETTTEETTTKETTTVVSTTKESSTKSTTVPAETSASETDKASTKPSTGKTDSTETVTAEDRENAAELGEWVSTLQNGKDMELGKIRYAITSITYDQDAILALIEGYNAKEENYRKVKAEIPADCSLRACEYEVIYEEDFPGYGDDGNVIYTPALSFGIASESGGGLDTTDGLSYIGLSVTDISPKVDQHLTGVAYKGLMVYMIPDKAAEQYYITLYYSDNDKKGNALSVYTYVLTEEIVVK
ncbi:MAG: hypothetical protein QM296_09430 [Bacillota bacterium]|nr:hypothetical protein [Bacillota bacterium]